MEAKAGQSSDIQQEFITRQKHLEAQIDHLDLFITDLTSHKISLENANRQIEQLALAEKDATKRGKFYTTLRMNIELLTKIFNSISELESIKHRYHKDINEVVYNKLKLINIDIRKIEESLKDNNMDMIGFFEKLGNAMSNLTKAGSTPVKTELENKPEYKL